MIASMCHRTKGIVDLFEISSTGPGSLSMTECSQAISCMARFFSV